MTDKVTPLHDIHTELGAKFTSFAGWNMPVWYEGIVAEHKAVREGVGVFDITHMGEISVVGELAYATLQYLTCNDLSGLSDGQALYSAILNRQGGVVDDVIIYRKSAENFMVCVNAANRAEDYQWLTENNPNGEVTITDVSDDTGLLAVQGPKAPRLVADLFGSSLTVLSRFEFQEVSYNDAKLMVARTGYTGEDGFEIFMPISLLTELWQKIGDAGAKPIGLGARDSLRLEACYSLHGHEISQTITPYEAGLAWIVKLDKGDFVGRDALIEHKEEGVKRKLIAFQIEGKGVARAGDTIINRQNEEIGVVTSGTIPPTINAPLGLALVDIEFAKEPELQVQIRKRVLPCKVVRPPFYRRKQ